MKQKSRLEVLADKDEIRELLYTYCYGLDRVDEGIIRSVFHPDAQLQNGQFTGDREEFLAYTTKMLPTLGPTSHNVTNQIIKIDGDVASGVTYCIAVCGDVELEGSYVDLIVYVHYVDRFERRDGSWKISRREVLYDWVQNLPRTARWTGDLYGAMKRGRRDGSDPGNRVIGGGAAG